jgi:hypothetical protein
MSGHRVLTSLLTSWREQDGVKLGFGWGNKPSGHERCKVTKGLILNEKTA